MTGQAFRLYHLLLLIPLLLLAVAVAPTSVVAQTGAPLIRKADVSDDETQLLIFGKNFCLNPVVKLSTIELEVVSVDLGGPEVIGYPHKQTSPPRHTPEGNRDGSLTPTEGSNDGNSQGSLPRHR